MADDKTESFADYIERFAVGGVATGLAIILAITTVSKDLFDAHLHAVVLYTAWSMTSFMVAIAGYVFLPEDRSKRREFPDLVLCGGGTTVGFALLLLMAKRVGPSPRSSAVAG
jgi:hypothetical protein